MVFLTQLSVTPAGVTLGSEEVVGRGHFGTGGTFRMKMLDGFGPESITDSLSLSPFPSKAELAWFGAQI